MKGFKELVDSVPKLPLRLELELNCDTVDDNHDNYKGATNRYDRVMKINRFPELKWIKPLRSQTILEERQEYFHVGCSASFIQDQMDLAYVIRDDPDEKISFEGENYTTNLKCISEQKIPPLEVNPIPANTWTAHERSEDDEKCEEFHGQTPMLKAEQVVQTRSRESSGESGGSGGSSKEARPPKVKTNFFTQEIRVKEEAKPTSSQRRRKGHNILSPKSKPVLTDIKLEIPQPVQTSPKIKSPQTKSSTQNATQVTTKSHPPKQLSSSSSSMPKKQKSYERQKSSDLDNNNSKPRLAPDKQDTPAEETKRCQMCNEEVPANWEWKRFCSHSCMFTYTQLYYQEFFKEGIDTPLASEIKILNGN